MTTPSGTASPSNDTMTPAQEFWFVLRFLCANLLKMPFSHSARFNVWLVVRFYLANAAKRAEVSGVMHVLSMHLNAIAEDDAALCGRFRRQDFSRADFENAAKRDQATEPLQALFVDGAMGYLPAGAKLQETAESSESSGGGAALVGA